LQSKLEEPTNGFPVGGWYVGSEDDDTILTFPPKSLELDPLPPFFIQESIDRFLPSWTARHRVPHNLSGSETFLFAWAWAWNASE